MSTIRRSVATNGVEKTKALHRLTWLSTLFKYANNRQYAVALNNDDDEDNIPLDDFGSDSDNILVNS